MRNLYIAVIVILIAVVLSSEAHALRCNGNLIRVGDTTYKLLKHCGRPAAVFIDVWRYKTTYIYEMNGREQRIIAIEGFIQTVLSKRF